MGPFFALLADIVGLAAVIFLAYITWVDFKTMRIPNAAVIFLLVLYVIWAALTGFENLAGDIGTSLLLFLISLTFWIMRLMGAGDVKLYFALGLFIGFEQLGLFAVLLLFFSVVFFLLLKISELSSTQTYIMRQLKRFNRNGMAAYAIVMNAAAIPAISVRLFA